MQVFVRTGTLILGCLPTPVVLIICAILLLTLNNLDGT